MLRKFLLTGLAANLLAISLPAQDNAARIAEQFNNYQGKVLQEKIYMHTDRDLYLGGDILWFKLYYVDASFHQALNVSKVAYIEILDADNKPVLQSKTSLADGSGKGSLFLPVNISSGAYKIRAYTNWMKNFGAEHFFEKRITIINPQKKRDIIAKAVPASIDVQFFPEGGNLVAGIPGKLACKVADRDGKGVVYEGTVIDEQNTIVASFHSRQFGMCSFDFTPAVNQRYKAVIEIPGKEKITKDLPAIYREGYVMSVETGNPLQLIVNVATNLIPAGEVYLVAHTRQSVKATMKASFKDGKAIFNIPKTILGDGISHVTVFNSARQPVCERLYFKYPENKLLIKVDGARPDYSTRSNIRFGITSMDALDKQKSADLSMAVYRVDSLQLTDEVDINNYLLLTSELKGYVESPGYYFRDEEAGAKAAAADNLMLTQGWRRFSWNDILQDKTPVFSFAPEYNGHLVTGRVTHSITGAPMENMETYLSIPGAKAGFFTSTSDGAGRIKYEIKNMQGSAEIIVQPDVIWDSVARIEIANPFSETYTNDSLPAFRLFSRIGNTLLDQSIATQVQNIYTGDKLKQFALFTDSTAFFEKPDGVYFLDDYTRFTTMEEVLREYVTFMDVRKRSGHFGLALLDMSTDNLFDLDPLMLVDGVPIFSADKLLRFDPVKIRKLEVVNRRYFLGNTFFNGIMNFRSYKGDVANAELNPHATVLDYEGLQLSREFYSPAYDTQEKLTSRLPDFRNLLYWTPDIRTNGKDSQQVSFYSSDRKGRYVAVIQGLSKNGNAGSGMVMFEVK